jgi:hypothetical protein
MQELTIGNFIKIINGKSRRVFNTAVIRVENSVAETER